MNKASIGIDLGTTNSALSFFRDNRPQLVSDPTSRSIRPYIFPSIVAENTSGELVIGDHAKSYLQSAIKESKRDMGSSDYDGTRYILPNHTLTPVEVAALILKRLVQIAVDVLSVDAIDEAVITVPANFSDSEKNATKDAAELAGITTVHLIAEPTAAYLSYGHDSDSVEDKAFVFDFGGGTLDISIVENIGGVAEGKGVGGDKLLGGKDIDAQFTQYLLEKFKSANPNSIIPDHKYSELNERAENTKIQLSSKETQKVFLANFAQVDDVWINLELEVSRKEFEESISDILKKCKSLIRESLLECGMKPSEVNTILLVGGSSHIPAVRDLVVTTFGAKVAGNIDPDTAVSMGASIRHAMLNDELDAEKGLVLMDVSRFGFGVETTTVISGFLKDGIYASLMPPQSHFPFEAKHEFALITPEQEEVEISVFQSDQKEIFLTAEAISTGVSGVISNIPPSTNGHPHKLEVLIKVDENNLISVTSNIPETKQVLPLIIDKFSKRLSPTEKSELEDKLSSLDFAQFTLNSTENESLNFIDVTDSVFETNEIGIETKPLVEKAQKIMTESNQIEVERLELLLTELYKALKANDNDTAAIYRDKLTNTLFDLEDI